jgi:hypothetical protein
MYITVTIMSVTDILVILFLVSVSVNLSVKITERDFFTVVATPSPSF